MRIKPKGSKINRVILIEDRTGLVRDLPERLAIKLMTQKDEFYQAYQRGQRKKPPRTYTQGLRIMTAEELETWKEAGKPGIFRMDLVTISNENAAKDAEIEKLKAEIEAMKTGGKKKPAAKSATDNPLFKEGGEA